METKYWRSLMVLALACFMAVPALSTPCEWGGAAPCRGGMLLLMDDMTNEDLSNMTLEEIRALRQQKVDELNNMTLGEIKELRRQKMDEMNNMTLAELKERIGPEWRDGSGPGAVSAGYGGNMGQGNTGRGRDLGNRCGAYFPQRGMIPQPFMAMMYDPVLMDDLTEEELNNMTLAEIRELRQQKVEELDNMTLAEIRELRQQKMEEMIDEMENTTLGELRGGRGSKGADWGRGPMDGRAGNSHPGFAGRW